MKIRNTQTFTRDKSIEQSIGEFEFKQLDHLGLVMSTIKKLGIIKNLINC